MRILFLPIVYHGGVIGSEVDIDFQECPNGECRVSPYQHARVMSELVARLPGRSDASIRMGSVAGFSFSHGWHTRLQQPDSFSPDDIDHRTIAHILRGMPDEVRLDYPTWGIPEILSEFKTASSRAYEAILEGSGIISAVNACKPGDKYFTCSQAHTMHALLLSELGSRETRAGEMPFRLLSAGEATETVCARIDYDYVRDQLRKVVRVGESLSHLESLKNFALANLQYLCKSPPVVSLNYVVLYHRIFRHVTTATTISVGEKRNVFLSEDGFDLDAELDRFASLPVEHILDRSGWNVVWDNVSSGPSRGYRAWIGRILTRLGDPNGKYFIPHKHNFRDTRLLRPANHSSSSRYIGIGRLLALSLIEQIPTGFPIDANLLKLLVSGLGSIAGDVRFRRWARYHVEDKNDQETLRDIAKRVSEEDTSMFFVPPVNHDDGGSRLGGVPRGTRLTRENIILWEDLVLDKIIYLENKLAYDAIITGFYEVLPNGILTHLIDEWSLGHLFTGCDRIIFYESVFDINDRELPTYLRSVDKSLLTYWLGSVYSEEQLMDLIQRFTSRRVIPYTDFDPILVLPVLGPGIEDTENRVVRITIDPKRYLAYTGNPSRDDELGDLSDREESTEDDF
jgi:hypothetical protein